MNYFISSVSMAILFSSMANASVLNCDIDYSYQDSTGATKTEHQTINKTFFNPQEKFIDETEQDTLTKDGRFQIRATGIHLVKNPGVTESFITVYDTKTKSLTSAAGRAKSPAFATGELHLGYDRNGISDQDQMDVNAIQVICTTKLH